MPATPHGGTLVQVQELAPAAKEFDGFSESSRVKVDAETIKTVWNMANGVYSPLDGFMERDEYASVLDQMKLKVDVAWTLPILLMTDQAEGAKDGDDLLLTEENGKPVAVLECHGAFSIDKSEH